MAPQKAARTDRISSLDELEVIVDADSHVTEGFDDLLAYLDDKYAGIRKIMAASDRPLGNVFSVAFPTPGFLAFEDTDPFGGMDSPEKKLEQLDEFNIDFSVIDPTLSSELNNVNNSRFAVALANAYNAYILDTFADYDERLKVTITVTAQKPHLAAEEIDDRASEKDVVGVHVPPSGLAPPLGNERYYPIYEACQDHDPPVIMHTVTGCTHLTFPVQHHRLACLRWRCG